MWKIMNYSLKLTILFVLVGLFYKSIVALYNHVIVTVVF